MAFTLRTIRAKILGPLALERTARVFLIVAFVDAAGRGLFLAGSALFYSKVVGLTNAEVGTGLSLAALCGFLCAVPIGKVADRYGNRPTLLFLQLWRAAGFLVYPLVSSFPAFLVVACAIGAVEVAVGPIIQSVAGSVAKGESLVRMMAIVAVVRNVAYSASALVATVVITVASSSGYVGFVLGNAVAFLVTAVLLARIHLPHRRVSDEGARATRQTRGLPDVPFLALAAANGLLYLHTTILSVALPLWIVTKTAAPDSLVGVALLLNTLMAVTLQVRLSRGADDLVRAAVLQRRAGFGLAVFCIVISATAATGPFAPALLALSAVASLTLGELWQSAGAWGVSFRLSPEEQRTYYLSVYNLGATAMAVLGPGLLTFAVVEQGVIGWLGLGGICALTGVAVPMVARKVAARERHAGTPATSPTTNVGRDD